MNRDGYIYLLMVLFVGMIALTVLGSYMVLSVTAIQSSNSVRVSMQALSNASSCIERAVVSLQEDLNYAGDETITLADGTCILEAIGGSGTGDRTLCATGVVGNNKRRLEVYVIQMLPMVQIRSWKEVTSFTQC
ncbi:hypothetical protein H6770_01405 [Candidatus Peribacteria bacterium]|nr:hypothetical protein [Candidatus Peribacteria bacterium]